MAYMHVSWVVISKNLYIFMLPYEVDESLLYAALS
jgi:hypothetical protein